MSESRKRSRAAGGETPTPEPGPGVAADRLRGVVVREVMTRDVVTAAPDWSLARAARTMREYRISGLPVVDNGGALVGVLSEKDIVSTLDRATGLGHARGLLDILLEENGSKELQRVGEAIRRLEHARVEQSMSRRPVTIDPEASFFEAARRLSQYAVTRLPVVDGGRLVGILTRQDLADALAK
jgi:CBS domain-containing protein